MSKELAYAQVYAAAIQAYIRAEIAHGNKPMMRPARESGRNCVKDFREMLQTFPECRDTYAAVPSDINTNPDVGKF